MQIADPRLELVPRRGEPSFWEVHLSEIIVKFWFENCVALWPDRGS